MQAERLLQPPELMETTGIFPGTLEMQIISVTLKLNYTKLFMNTLYTILAIMFSIGLGLLVTFNLGGIKNRELITRIRKNLKLIRSLYIGYFVIATIFYLFESQLKSLKINRFLIYDSDNFRLQFDFSAFTVCVLLYSIVTVL